MPSLKALRKRVATVRSTQKITKAMKMVAAARLRRAQEAAERARPYAAKLAETFAVVAAGIEPEAHPLLARREERRIDLVILTSDRGLCGGYNANLLRAAEGFVRKQSAEAALAVVGRKGVEYFRRRGARIVQQHVAVAATPVAELTRTLAEAVTQRFEQELYSFLEAKHPTVLTGLASKRELTDEIKGALDRALAEFAKVFRA